MGLKLYLMSGSHLRGTSWTQIGTPHLYNYIKKKLKKLGLSFLYRFSGFFESVTTESDNFSFADNGELYYEFSTGNLVMGSWLIESS